MNLLVQSKERDFFEKKRDFSEKGGDFFEKGGDLFSCFAICNKGYNKITTELNTDQLGTKEKIF